MTLAAPAASDVSFEYQASFGGFGIGRESFDLPVDVAQARATLEGGLLTITLPRLRERRGRETVIPVEKEGDE